jgi:hypothetical protein
MLIRFVYMVVMASLVLLLHAQHSAAKERMVSAFRCNRFGQGTDDTYVDQAMKGLVHVGVYVYPAKVYCPIPRDSYITLSGITLVNMHGVDGTSSPVGAGPNAWAMTCVDFRVSVGGSCGSSQPADTTYGPFTVGLSGSKLQPFQTYPTHLGYIVVGLPGTQEQNFPSGLKGYFIAAN